MDREQIVFSKWSSVVIPFETAIAPASTAIAQLCSLPAGAKRACRTGDVLKSALGNIDKQVTRLTAKALSMRTS